MSQQDLQYNLLRAEDTLNQIIWHKQLLDIAIEHTTTFNEANFDRITILLESYVMLFDCETNHLEYLLGEVKSSATLSNTLTS